MSLVINTNLTEMSTLKKMQIHNKNVNSSIEKLGSGFKINRAEDNASGLSISEAMRSKIRGNQNALKNAQDGISLLHLAEGGLENMTESIQRIRDLTVQAANGTYSTEEREAIAREVKARIEDINRIANSVKYNNLELLNGTSQTAKLQIGGNSTPITNVLTVGNALLTATASALGFSNIALLSASAAGKYFDGSSARAFLGTIDNALETLTERRSLIGSYENKLQSIINTLTTQEINLSAAESRIRDLNIAEESSKLTRNQVLQKASVSIFSQANQNSSNALQLIS